MGKTGDQINRVATQREGLTLTIGDKTFDLYYDFEMPETVIEEAHKYAEKMTEETEKNATDPTDGDEKDRLYTNHLYRYLAAVGFRDKDGNRVWERPEDINMGLRFSKISTFILRKVLGLSFTAAEAKK
ncbi:MAG: hypothetical protein JW885_02830 [Deltaproteobacteria bacterium]|nr:hypothetical protein [Candidatus Zymogenaceae bacterium]